MKLIKKILFTQILCFKEQIHKKIREITGMFTFSTYFPVTWFWKNWPRNEESYITVPVP